MKSLCLGGRLIKNIIGRLAYFFDRISLTQKFLITTVTIVFGLLFIMNIMIYQDFKNFIIKSEQESFDAKFRNILMSKTSLYVYRNLWNEYIDFSTLFNSLDFEPELIDIVVYDNKGKRLAVKNSKQLLSLNNESDGLKIALKGENFYEIKHIDKVESAHYLMNIKNVEYVQEIYIPVVFSGEIKGVMEVYKNATNVIHNINHVRVRASIFTLLGFIAYIFMLYLVVKKIEEREIALNEKVNQLEKISLLGQFASKMAHELGTPIHVILGNADLLLEMYEDEFVKERAESIVRQTSKMKTIIKNYLYASKKPDPNIEEFNLKVLIENLIQDISFTISDNIKIDYTTSDYDIVSDRGFIEQILFNFIKNSADSIGADNGQIEVKSIIKKPIVDISVTDNGKGVPKEVIDKIFNPFFSTKKTGKGTGLGLSVCKELAEALKGEIYFESNNKNTTFGIRIPVNYYEA